MYDPKFYFSELIRTLVENLSVYSLCIIWWQNLGNFSFDVHVLPQCNFDFMKVWGCITLISLIDSWSRVKNMIFKSPYLPSFFLSYVIFVLSIFFLWSSLPLHIVVSYILFYSTYIALNKHQKVSIHCLVKVVITDRPLIFTPWPCSADACIMLILLFTKLDLLNRKDLVQQIIKMACVSYLLST